MTRISASFDKSYLTRYLSILGENVPWIYGNYLGTPGFSSYEESLHDLAGIDAEKFVDDILTQRRVGIVRWDAVNDELWPVCTRSVTSAAIDRKLVIELGNDRQELKFG